VFGYLCVEVNTKVPDALNLCVFGTVHVCGAGMFSKPVYTLFCLFCLHSILCIEIDLFFVVFWGQTLLLISSMTNCYLYVTTYMYFYIHMALIFTILNLSKTCQRIGSAVCFSSAIINNLV